MSASPQPLRSAAPAPVASSALPVGETIDRGFALIARRPRALLLPPVVLMLIGLAVALVLGAIGALALGSVATTTKTVRESTFFGDSTLNVRDVADYTGGQTAVLIGLGALAGLVLLWCLIAAVVAGVRAIERAREGRPPVAVGTAVHDGLRAAPPLFGLTVVLALFVAAALAVAGAIVVLVAQASLDLALLLGLLALLAAVYVGVRLCLWPIVALTEGGGIVAFARAWRLTRQRFWALLAVLLLTAIVVGVVFAVLGVALDLVYGALVHRDAIVGVAALLPSLLLAVLFGAVLTALAVAPLAVAHRFLAGSGDDA